MARLHYLVLMIVAAALACGQAPVVTGRVAAVRTTADELGETLPDIRVMTVRCRSTLLPSSITIFVEQGGSIRS